jgi:hypothetical protein
MLPPSASSSETLVHYHNTTQRHNRRIPWLESLPSWNPQILQCRNCVLKNFNFSFSEYLRFFFFFTCTCLIGVCKWAVKILLVKWLSMAERPVFLSQNSAKHAPVSHPASAYLKAAVSSSHVYEAAATSSNKARIGQLSWEHHEHLLTQISEVYINTDITIRSFVTCTLYEILLQWSSQGRCDKRGM